MTMNYDEILHRFTLTDVDKIIVTDDEIGRGAYGRVFKVKYYGKVCAAKEVHSILLEKVRREELQQMKSMFLRECCQCCVLRHPNIVQFLGVYYPRHYKTGVHVAPRLNELPVIVMELMKSSLKTYVEMSEQNKITIPYVSKLSILQDVAHGLMYLHDQKPPVIHRDLSPNNVLLTDHLVAKIGDLGVAKAITTDCTNSMTKLPGTVDFMPPEALTGYGPSLDVFSYGGIALFLASQQWPKLLPIKLFDQFRGQAVMLSEIDRRKTYIDDMTGNVIELKPFIMECLDDNPSARPTAARIVETISDFFNRRNSVSPGNQQQFITHPQHLDMNKEAMPLTRSNSIRITCRAPGCLFDVLQESEGYCSACYRSVKINSIQPSLTLLRAFELADASTAQRVQQEMRSDCSRSFSRCGTVFFQTFPAFTLYFPSLDIQRYPAGFVEYVSKSLTDKHAKETLEKNFKCVNWQSECSYLVPLYTTNDCNCLLHAASLAMWGVEDKQFTLRNALYDSMVAALPMLQDRCRQLIGAELRGVGVNLSDYDWAGEWRTMVNQASPNSSGYQQSLEKSHVFVLANVLQRPIIVYGLPKMTSFYTRGTVRNVSLQGVYLPLLWGSQACHKAPLCLGYSLGHFTALVPVSTSHKQSIVPMVDNVGRDLPVYFLLQSEKQNTFCILKQYLDITEQYISTLCRPVNVSIITIREAAHVPQLVNNYINAAFAEFTKQTQPYLPRPTPPIPQLQDIQYPPRSYNQSHAVNQYVRNNPPSPQPINRLREKRRCHNCEEYFASYELKELCSNCVPPIGQNAKDDAEPVAEKCIKCKDFYGCKQWHVLCVL